MTAINPIIEVKNLTVYYEDNLILDDLSFEIFPGEIFVILGGSGCGKTTLLRAMTGLLPPRNGQVLFEGEDMISAGEKKRQAIMKKFGILFQSGALLGSMTLGENVALPLEESRKLPEELIVELVRMKLKLVNLQGKEHLMLDSRVAGA